MLTITCSGATVMLLKIFIVEYNLMNSTVGTVKTIVYKYLEGPKTPKPQNPMG